ncbi:MAG: 8-oxoguanine deaminase [Candidatus Krumholzibacteria bacterium]|nr:8-oxoguanine deaminase [Candidatus Krumholzibacteria bacterium]
MTESSHFLIKNIGTLVTMNQDHEVLTDAWVAATDGMITAVDQGPVPVQIGEVPVEQFTVYDAADCLVLPGLINTHHHLFQTRTRAWRGAIDSELFDWLKTLYPVWAELSDDDFYRAAVIGFRELMRSGCTLTTDHHYLFPTGASPHLIDITIEAAAEVGIRFHPTRGSMSRSVKDGGLPPDSVVQDPETILADSERVIGKWHDPKPGAMVRIALAPCSPFSVSDELMRDTAILAREHGVRLHTHLGETKDENDYCHDTYKQRPLDFLESVGWLASDVWLAHGIWFTDEEIARLGSAGVGIAHCPTSNMRLGSGVCRVRDLRAAGCPVGLAVDGSASNDSSNLLAELRQTLLLHRVTGGAAGMTVNEVLEMATLGGAGCLGRTDVGAVEPGRACDLAVFDLEAVGYDGADDPVAALLLCHPEPARAVVVGGNIIDIS